MVTFNVFLPFSKQWKKFYLKAGVASEAYALRLSDLGVTFTRS